MTQKKPPSALQALFSTATRDRVQAAKMYFSGELDSRRAELLKNGDRPWRILRYERIVDPEKIPYPVSRYSYVRPEAFEKQLRYLVKNCRVIPLEMLAESIWEKKEISDKTVAITFDGGWIDNFVYAYPLLRKYNVPATMFLPTAFIGTGNFFWHDKVLIAMHRMMQADMNFGPFSFFTPEEAEVVRAAAGPDNKISLQLIFLVIGCLSAHSVENRRRAVETLGHVVGQLGADLPAEPAFMSWDDVRIMRDGPVSVGSMSHSHSRFTELSTDKIKEEITTSMNLLNEHAKNVSPGFCFPEAAVSAPALEVCSDLKIPFTVVHESAPLPVLQTQRPLILPRESIYQSDTFATELFACRLWLPPETVE